MIRPIFIFILGLLFFQNAKAQQDTLVFYMKNSGEAVINKDSADYFRVILPPDTSVDKNLYPVMEYYPNGKRKMLAATSTKTVHLTLQGPCTTFYPNGHRKSVANYQYGYLIGDVTMYYPNGQLYATAVYIRHQARRLVDCRDSTGKILAENGNGVFITFDDDRKKIIEDGPVKDSLEEGEWHGVGVQSEWHAMAVDSIKYDILYAKGEPISGTGYDKTGKAYPFTNPEVDPSFKGGVGNFIKFLNQTVHYPALDKQNNVQGRVIVQFIIEKDGSLTDIKAVRAPDQSLADEAVRAMKVSPPWNPGLQYGMPVPVLFTVPVSFTLNAN